MQASIPPSMLTCFRGGGVGKNEQPRIVELLPAPCFSATLQQSSKHILQQNHYNKLPQNTSS
ncbi:hypothetical protein I79_026246 [Cricetulus griseus]|uniref:Uncharacterized protein n=1 Tax=Cricetulus griseus TaxID=10029 RepID=G3IQC8_CRIGR|nr:hypothetical protein I79_026246 [Cricetulus griseus]